MVSRFHRPSVAHLQRLLLPQRKWFAPQFSGLEHLDAKKPALYVGNHTLYGMFDGPLMVLGLYQQHNIFLRSLADHWHFLVPVWRDLLTKYGAVSGTPENCRELMQAGEHILVYPGGGREVMKNKGEEYRLVWKQRTGFARMAIEHGYDIIPFAAIGGDDVLRIRYDANDFHTSKLGRLLRQTGVTQRYLRNGDAFLPLSTGIAGLPALPRPEKMYFAFGERISTKELQGRTSEKNQWQIREQVSGTIYDLMTELFAQREAEQPQWAWWRRHLIQR